MRYYLLKQNKSITDAPEVNDFYEGIRTEDLTLSNEKKVPSRTLKTVKNNEHIIFPSLMINPVLMFVREVYKVVKVYNPHIITKQLILLDQESEKAEVYYIPILKRIDCIADISKINPMGGYIDKPHLKLGPIEDASLFALEGTLTTHVIMRMDMAESLLNRNYTGIEYYETYVD